MKKVMAAVLAFGLVAGGANVATAAGNGFSDVLPTNPYSTYISDLAEKGVVVGYAGKFNPTDRLTRAEFATLLVKAFDLPGSQSPVKFADSKNHWGASFIQAGAEAGAIAGTSETTFEPEALVKREEAAAMVWRLLAKRGVQPKSAELATSTSDWAKEAVQSVVAYRLHGLEVQNNNYESQRPMNRQEAAALFSLGLKVPAAGQKVKINPTNDPSNLVSQADGTKRLGNIIIDQTVAEDAVKHNENLFSAVSVTLDGKNVKLELPATGNPDLHWSISDTTNKVDWEGSTAKALSFQNT